MKSRRVAGAFVALLTSCAGAQMAAPDLSTSTMEELTQMQVSINSVSRKDEDLWRTAAAAYVITREDIAHSAANSIPELLRSVPGLQLAQISASTWAVSARGFNSAYANKLLVLIDGRTVYSEIYSGAHWDEIDLALDDVERIEVIRGPEAVIWGTNAVNGVINIITRPARAVQAPTITGEVSRIDDSASFARGSSFRNDAQYRASLSLVNRNPLEEAGGMSAYDGELLYRAHARFDWQKNSGTRVSVLGGAYGGTLRQETMSSSSSMMNLVDGQENDFLVGGFGLIRLNRETARNGYEVQGYVSDAVRHELTATGRTVTESVEFVDHFQASTRVDLISGAEFRLTQDAAQAPTPVLLNSNYNNYLLDGFLQADFNLISNRLTATLGSKVQDGTLAGFQVQPTARLGWTIDASQFAWAAASRGVVAPSIQDRALTLDLLVGMQDGMPIEGNLTGNPAFKPETVLAYEAGYRRHITPNLSVDIAAFYNFNHRLQSVSSGMPSLMTDPMVHIMLPLTYGNGFSATSQGVEGSLDWKPTSSLSLRANYTWLEAQTTQKQPGEVSLVDSFDSPRNSIAGLWRWSFASHWNFGGQVDRVGSLQIDNSPGSMLSTTTDDNSGTMMATSSGVSSRASRKPQSHDDSDDDMLSALAESSSSVPAYTRLDLNLERSVGDHLGLAVGGTNLLSPRHQEFGGSSAFLAPLYVPRSVFLRARWNF